MLTPTLSDKFTRVLSLMNELEKEVHAVQSPAKPRSSMSHPIREEGVADASSRCVSHLPAIQCRTGIGTCIRKFSMRSSRC